MSKDDESLRAVVGRNVRALRDRLGLTADDVAAEARALGLAWQRSTVASIETARRGLGAEELLLLPVILSRASGWQPVTISDLLESERPIELASSSHGGTRATTAGLEEVLAGERITVPAWQIDDQFRAAREGVDRLRELGRLLPKRTAHEEALRAAEDGQHEAEQKAARKLGRPAVQIAHAARRRWGRSLTAERDARVAERLEAGDVDPSSVPAVRGHVTRDLLAVLAEDLTKYPELEEG